MNFVIEIINERNYFTIAATCNVFIIRLVFCYGFLFSRYSGKRSFGLVAFSVFRVLSENNHSLNPLGEVSKQEMGCTQIRKRYLRSLNKRLLLMNKLKTC